MTSTFQSALSFERRYSTPGDPYAGINFVPRSSVSRDKDGSILFEQHNILVPDFWSQTAVDTIATKYLRRAGVPSDVVFIDEPDVPEFIRRAEAATDAAFGGETDTRQTFRRLAGCWTYWGWKYGYFQNNVELARAYFEEMQAMLALQIASANSPQWFNTGLHWAYGITGTPEGHYFVDPTTGECAPSKDAYTHPQVSACFIRSVKDDLVNPGGIMHGVLDEARIFKHGSGSGSNFSDIRGEGEKLSGGGTSSGLMSFLKVYDRGAGAIKSGGTTRRAAKMCILDLDHVEIEAFVGWKAREERKVVDLIVGSITVEKHINAILKATKNASVAAADRTNFKANSQLAEAIREALQARIPQAVVKQTLAYADQGISEIDVEIFDGDWQGEAYNTVSGQNSNNSVSIPNRFFRAVDTDAPWDLIGRTTGKPMKTLQARDLWKQIGMAAWQCADPGVQYNDTMNEWNTCLNDARIKGTNPCSEFVWLDNSACNLASINLVKFYDGTRFDVESFAYVSRLWTLALDISVSMGQMPTQLIAETNAQTRPIGLGYANLGALLMRMAIPYDSPKAMDWTAMITAVMTGSAYKTSAQLASYLGAFPAFERNREHTLRVLRNHRHAAYKGDRAGYEGLTIIPAITGLADYASADGWKIAREIWDDAVATAEDFGARNAQTTLLAPTGTIGIQMQCDTTGIEPDYALVKDKKLAGGGYFKLVNDSVEPALRQLGYTEAQIADIRTYALGTNTLTDEARVLLAQAGANAEIIERIDATCPNAFTFPMAAGMHGVDVATLIAIAGQAKLDEISETICGTRTVEGAPHLEAEHLPVFDCATPCGRKGTRFISADAHLMIMAAAQPFLSGGISKTVNTPESTTIEEILAIYRRSWELGIKCVAIYRENSKLSAVLSGSGDFDVFAELTNAPRSIEQSVDVLLRGMQRKLKKRRSGYTQAADIGGHRVYLRTGDYEDGTLGEIFIDMSKEGAAFRAMMNAFAMAVSAGLQYGVPLEEYVRMFTFTRFEPNGPVSGHDYLKNATSILDYIFRELGITYLGMTELAHIQPDEAPSTVGAASEQGEMAVQPMLNLHPRNGHVGSNGTAVVSTTMSAREVAKASGFTGDPCNSCGSPRMVRNGTCARCLDCSQSSGCS